jgi:hypothetical protein
MDGIMIIFHEHPKSQFQVGDMIKSQPHPYLKDKILIVVGFTEGFKYQNPLYCTVDIAENNRMSTHNMVTMDMTYYRVA